MSSRTKSWLEQTFPQVTKFSPFTSKTHFPAGLVLTRQTITTFPIHSPYYLSLENDSLCFAKLEGF